MKTEKASAETIAASDARLEALEVGEARAGAARQIQA